MTGPGTIEHPDYYTSETHTQTGTETGLVHRKVFQYPGAAALRVAFASYTLGPNDWVEVYSPITGERHKLTNAEFAKWQGTSGFFNGDTLWIDLYLAPGSSGSFDIASYFVGLGGIVSNAHGYGYQTICGSDDRIQSTDNRSARFVANGSVTGGGCTIWLASADGCAVSAGHCFNGGNLMLAEFNVPPSLSNGALQHPPLADQFPIDPATVTFVDGGVGNDWGVCKILPNNLGQIASTLHGHHNVVATVPSLNDTIRITGFGTDSGVDNQTNQTDTGPLTNNGGTTLSYMTDTTGGNSGSPVIHEATGDAVGIHTHGGCTSTGGANSGTSSSHPAFQTAFTALCNLVPAVPVATFNAAPTTILAGQSVSFSDTSTGVPTTWAWDFNDDAIIDATTPAASFQYTTPGTYTVTLTVTNALGTDTIVMTDLVTVNAVTPVSVPFSEDFSGGLPAAGSWSFQSIGSTGRIITGTQGDVSPVSGAPALIMDSSVNSTYATNEAILFVDLATTGGGVLTYYFREMSDEPDPEDGVFLSDGVTEILLQDNGNGPQVWTEYIIDLTAAAANAGMTLTNNMQIIFRQRDNFTAPTDGHQFDDIRILAPVVPDTGQANQLEASLVAEGMLDKDGFVPSPGQNGPFFVTHTYGEIMRLSFQGPPSGFMVVIAGQLNRNNAFFPGTGQLDIGMLGFSDFSDIVVLIDGVNPTSLIDAFGALTPAGEQSFAAYIPPSFPIGNVVTFQAFMTPNLKLSAAVELIIQ